MDGLGKAVLPQVLEQAPDDVVVLLQLDVVTAKPGFVDTVMTADLPGHPPGLAPIPVEDAARACLALATGRSRTGFVPRRWALVGFIVRAIPSWLFRRTNI